MAKLNTRKVQAQHPTHMAGPGVPGSAGIPSSSGMTASSGRQPSGMVLGGSQLHHHHAHPDGNGAGGTDDVSGMFHQM